VELTGFRITNFRSIADTGWFSLSSDGVTAFVGQNESGKTSLLEALAAFDTAEIGTDDRRDRETYPTVGLRLKVTPDEIEAAMPEAVPAGVVSQIIDSCGGTVDIRRTWTDIRESTLASGTALVSLVGEDLDVEDPSLLDQELAKSLWEVAPSLVLFENVPGMLPDSIGYGDLENESSEAQGVVGARNYLRVAGLDIAALREGDKRLRENAVADGNRRLNALLSSYWSQTLGETLTVSLEAQVDGADGPLNFMVKDGEISYYPHQRSQGLRWYLSFFLQMLAEDGGGVVYLVDEPGANLHATAQRNVLAVFEKVRRTFPVLYTTHSPYLVDKSKIGRVVAVQRADAEDNRCPTELFRSSDFARLKGNRDTLSPIYTAMGVDYSHQDVVGRDNNVILEELSAYYYLQAFYLLKGRTDVPHLLPATGADAVTVFANLLLGWGLDFIVLLDGDSKGRQVRDRLRDETFAGDGAEAARRTLLLEKAHCIEALFTKPDVKRYVLRSAAAPQDVCSAIADSPKACLALQFYNDVQDGRIALSDLQPTTIERITRLLSRIDAGLCRRDKPELVP
jgi:hypothetical protein